jgi:glucose uptake protein GlcU
MIWQDYVITIILWVFVLCSVPLAVHTLKGKTYSPQKTNIPTALGNYSLAIIWLTFPEPLILSFTTNLLVGIVWTLISIGSWKYHKRIYVSDNVLK